MADETTGVPEKCDLCGDPPMTGYMLCASCNAKVHGCASGIHDCFDGLCGCWDCKECNPTCVCRGCGHETENCHCEPDGGEYDDGYEP